MMAVELIDISTQYEDQDIEWKGPGWYASHVHLARNRKQFVRYYQVGNDLESPPDTLPGLGSAFWLDEPKLPW